MIPYHDKDVDTQCSDMQFEELQSAILSIPDSPVP